MNKKMFFKRVLCVAAAAAVTTASLVACGNGNDNDNGDGDIVFRGECVTEQEWNEMTEAFLYGWNCNSVTANIDECYEYSEDVGSDTVQTETLNGVWKIDLNNERESIVFEDRYGEEKQYRLKDGDRWYNVFRIDNADEWTVHELVDDYNLRNIVERVDLDAIEISGDVFAEYSFCDFEFDEEDGAYVVIYDGDEYRIYFRGDYLMGVRLNIGSSYQSCYFTDINTTVADEPSDEAYTALEKYIAEHDLKF